MNIKPQEKAIELIEMFKAAIGNTVEADHMDSGVDYIDEAAVKSAIIAVDEIIKLLYKKSDLWNEEMNGYYLQVKEEIIKYKQH